MQAVNLSSRSTPSVPRARDLDPDDNPILSVGLNDATLYDNEGDGDEVANATEKAQGDAFFAGFRVSTEGFNGEVDESGEADVLLERKFSDWKESYGSRTAPIPEVKFSIKVYRNTTDITKRVAANHAVDGGRRINHPIGSLDNLTENEAITCLSQIIDEGREHGPTDAEAEVLYNLIGPVISRGEGPSSPRPMVG
jgi:hypothetical protein